jgi:cyclohexa-1,5-dienecarbonyl-CoA hydratase
VTSDVRVEHLEQGGLLSIVFERPKGNVLTRATMQELEAALVEHQDDRRLRLVTLRGAGKNFSFGASVEEHRREAAPAMLATFLSLVRRIGHYPIPIAALVDGRCLGGAFELALACHAVIATPRAIFACPEIKLGVIPPVLAALGPVRLGAALAERLLLTGAELSAKDAGDFVWLVAEDDLEETALAWYRATLAPLSAYALRQGTLAIRESSGFSLLLERGIATAERIYVERVLPSLDGNEGIEAFIEKRAPRWSDA